MGFPGGSSGKESTCNSGDLFNPWVGKIPWRRKWQPVLVVLPGKFHGQRNLEGYSPWGHKESDTAEGLTLSHADDTSLMAESEEKPLDEGEIGE